jgi:Integrase core domain
MCQDIKKNVLSCHECQVCDKSETNPQSLWPIQVTCLFQKFGLDYIAPMTESTSGNKYLLVITEYYARYPVAFAVQSVDARTTATILYNHVFCTFGPPSEILTDRGSHFANDIVRSLCETVEVNHKFSTPYHPQTNGLTERFNGTLVNIQRKLAVNFPNEWDQHVGTTLYAYRIRIYSALNYSRYELLFGTAPKGTDQIQSKWFPNPYIVYWAQDNHTYDLIDHEGNFFRSCMNVHWLKLYRPRDNAELEEDSENESAASASD